MKNTIFLVAAIISTSLASMLLIIVISTGGLLSGKEIFSSVSSIIAGGIALIGALLTVSEMNKSRKIQEEKYNEAKELENNLNYKREFEKVIKEIIKKHNTIETKIPIHSSPLLFFNTHQIEKGSKNYIITHDWIKESICIFNELNKNLTLLSEILTVIDPTSNNTDLEIEFINALSKSSEILINYSNAFISIPSNVIFQQRDSGECILKLAPQDYFIISQILFEIIDAILLLSIYSNKMSESKGKELIKMKKPLQSMQNISMNDFEDLINSIINRYK